MDSSLFSLYHQPSAMEPLTPSAEFFHLEWLALELIKKSAQLSGALNPFTRSAIAGLVRPMNSYYSNLIEGHDTHPIDIASALAKNYAGDVKRRNLQFEALAHIELHRSLSTTIRSGENTVNPAASHFLKDLHRRFYEHLPEAFKTIQAPDGLPLTLIPGEFRTREVEVGEHIAPAAASLSGFMSRFESVYNPAAASNRQLTRRIINCAASHHRLAWIHPFLDGNGRVVRLFSDAVFMREDLDAGGLWSISRGLARRNETYKAKLALADEKRLSDLDGRGNLSDKRLAEFCLFFLETAVDQADFMFRILDVQGMLDRIHHFAVLMKSRKILRQESEFLLAELFLRGRVTKTGAMRITNLSDKPLKLLVEDLQRLDLLEARKESIHIVYYPKYPIAYSPFLFPGLFPANKEAEMAAVI